MLLIFRF